jgi:F-type H+-transporting ATPase subunit b
LEVSTRQADEEIKRAREQLRDRVASLAVAGAEKILRREVDAKAHGELLESIKRQL